VAATLWKLLILKVQPSGTRLIVLEYSFGAHFTLAKSCISIGNNGKPRRIIDIFDQLGKSF
jgi:hypothetical protein